MGAGWFGFAMLGLVCWMSAAVAATAPQAVAMVQLQPDQRVERSLQGGETLALELPESPANSPWIVLVEQFNINVQIGCGEDKPHSAPTGRVGIDVAIANGSARCQLGSRMPMARPGRVVISLHAADSRPLGADLALWQRLLAAYRQGETQVEQDAAIGLLEGLENEPADGLFRLSVVYARGKLRMRRSLTDAALADLRLAVELAEAHGLREFLPAIHNGAGLSLLGTRDLDEADRAFQLAEQVARAIGAGYELASALNNRGLANHHRGDLRSAARYYQDAIEAYRQAGENEHVAVPLMNHASVAGGLGQIAPARAALEQVIEIRRRGPSKRSLALALQNMGQLNATVGDWRSALASTLEAQQLLESLGQPADLVSIYLIRSQIYLDLGQRERASYYTELARAQLAPTVAPLHGPFVDSMLAQLNPDTAAAMAQHRAAARGHRQNGRLASAVLARLDEAELAASIGDWSVLTEALSEIALDIARTRPGLRARQQLLESELRLARADLRSASELVDQAEASFLQLRDYRGAFKAALLRARIMLGSQRHAQTESALLAAVDAYRRLTASVPTPNLAASLAGARGPWKDVALAWTQAQGNDPRALQGLASMLDRWPQGMALDAIVPADLLASYRYKVSALAGEDLDDELRGELVGELEALESAIEAGSRSAAQRREPIDAEHASALLHPYIRYVIGTERSLLLYPLDAQFAAVLLPGRSELEQQITQGLASAWQFRALAETLLPASVRALPGPIAVQADERLHDLPFAALWQAAGGPLTAAPYLTASGAASPARLAALGADLRLASLLPAIEGQPALTGVGLERASLSELLGDRFMTVSADPTSAIQLPAAQIIHVAGHGWVDRARPMASAVADLPFGTFAGASGLIEPTRITAASRPGLVLLSACDGASSDGHGGGYSLALAYARHFDAPVIAPTEPVDDADAAHFMRALLGHLQREDIASAFSAALRETAGGGVRHYATWQLIVP